MSYLLNFGIFLNVDLLASVFFQLNSTDSIQSDVTGQGGPATERFGIDGGVYYLQHHVTIIHIYWGAVRERRL